MSEAWLVFESQFWCDGQSYLRPLPWLLCLWASISLPHLVVSSLCLAPLCCEHTALQALALGVELYLPGDVFVLVTIFKALIWALFLDLLFLTWPWRSHLGFFWLSNASPPEAKVCEESWEGQTNMCVEHKLPSFPYSRNSELSQVLGSGIELCTHFIQTGKLSGTKLISPKRLLISQSVQCPGWEVGEQMSSIKTNFLLPLCLVEQNYVCLFGWLESAPVRNKTECGCSST